MLTKGMHKKFRSLLVVLLLAAAARASAAVSDAELTRNIQRQLSNLDYGSRRPVVTVIVERVAKVKGVQAIDNKVTVLPANQSDDRLRVQIANAIYRLPEFERYSMADPPIHIVVNRGHVTLIGFLRSEIEKRKAYEA